MMKQVRSLKQEATYFSWWQFTKTNGKIASVDIIDVEDEIIYSVENGVVVKETKKEELENYFNFVVLHD